MDGGYSGTQAQWLASLQGANGQGVPAGGAVGYTLAKKTAADHDTEWVKAPSASGPTNLTAVEKAQFRANIGATVYGPNLLLNALLSNPCNFRGAVSDTVITSAGYFLDMWKLISGSVKWVANTGVYLYAASKIRQYLELPTSQVASKTVTLSLQTSAGITYVGTGAFPAVGAAVTTTAPVTVAGLGVITFGIKYVVTSEKIWGFDANYIPYVDIEVTADTSIARCQLEYGNVSSMEYTPPMPFYFNQMACQRYYKSFSSWAFFFYLYDTYNTRAYCFGYFPHNPRLRYNATPVITSATLTNVGAVTPVVYISNDEAFSKVYVTIATQPAANSLCGCNGYIDASILPAGGD